MQMSATNNKLHSEKVSGFNFANAAITIFAMEGVKR
jgi:hypothetical protein